MISYVKVTSGTCSKKSRYNLIFPFPVTKQFLSKCKKAGFVDNQKMTQSGLLYIQKDNVSISGAFNLKYATVTCKLSDCEEEIKKLVELLNSLL